MSTVTPLPRKMDVPDAAAGRALARIDTVVKGKYRIQWMLGMGGMAAVYAAAHRNGHRVAIKFLRDHLRGDPDVCRLFSREAYMANEVGHPRAVPVLDDDVDEQGCPFLIMPLLEGGSLRARRDRAQRHLPLVEVGVFMLDVLDVLAAAPAKGIVHRDIKPDNLFLTTAGEVHVLDFGIARRTDADGSTTVTGRLFGTPAFMPPEQALAKRDAIGPHCDVWAAGATMFALLSGELVHPADNPGAQLVAAATRPARSVAEVAPELPASVIAFMDKALAFNSVDRWSSGAEMHDALRGALEEALREPTAGLAKRVRARLAIDLGATGVDAHQETTERPQRVLEGAPRGSLNLQESPPTVAAQSDQRLHVKQWGWRTLLLVACGISVAAPFSIAVRQRLPVPAHVGDEKMPGITPRNSEADIEFNIGVQRLRDADGYEALMRFGRAVELDPTLAAAHLYPVMLSWWTDDMMRRHHHAATIHRHRLGPRDRGLLEAFAPSMRVPPDYHESAEQMLSLRRTFPEDWLVLLASGLTYIKIGELEAANEVLAELSSRDPSLAIGWAFRAVLLALMSHIDDARTAFAECLRLSPYATRCLIAVASLEMNEGNCLTAEGHLRSAITEPTTSHAGFTRLAELAHRSGRSQEAIEDLLQRAWPRAPEAERDIIRYRIEASLHVLSGAFDEARRVDDVWRRDLAGYKYESQHIAAEKMRMFLALELGTPIRAAREAAEFLGAREAWFSDSFPGWEILGLRVQYLAGGISRDDFRKRRQSWLDREALAPRHAGEPNQRWIYGYALAVATPTDAAEALRLLPQFLPMTNPYFRDTELDYGIGLAHMRAGDVDTALVYLHRAVNSCKVFDFPFEHTWAHLELGRALEQKRDTPGACTAYGVVIQRWGKEPRSVSAKSARARRAALHCPPIPPGP